MEAASLLISLIIGIPFIGLAVLLTAVVLQWAYKLVCKRDLRYPKACKLILALFGINVAINFIVSGATVSMDLAEQQYVQWAMIPVTFLIAAGIYAHWLNDKRGRPIGWPKALLVQGIFTAIMLVIGFVIAIPLVLLGIKFG